MAKKKLLASAALTVGVLGGGVAGVILGVPGVSGAQTTTVPDAPSTAPGGPQTTPDRAPDGGKDCPDKAGTAPTGSTPGQATSGAATNAAVRRGGVRSV